MFGGPLQWGSSLMPAERTDQQGEALGPYPLSFLSALTKYLCSEIPNVGGAASHKGGEWILGLWDGLIVVGRA